ncbi:MAG: hypothetical protein H6851_07355 [Geminicoccaceae bacterium]|nr:hypothetical protein [Geminicoccaceae bacterium]
MNFFEESSVSLSIVQCWNYFISQNASDERMFMREKGKKTAFCSEFRKNKFAYDLFAQLPYKKKRTGSSRMLNCEGKKRNVSACRPVTLTGRAHPAPSLPFCRGHVTWSINHWLTIDDRSLSNFLKCSLSR